MKILYLECAMGAAGDMLMSALTELLPNPQDFLDYMNSLDLPGVCFELQSKEKCGIHGTHIAVTVHGEEEQSEDVHNHEHNHEHSHEHDHEHDHDHDHDHDHHHDHNHDHAHHHHHDHSHGQGHHHAHVSDIEGIIRGLAVSDYVKESAIAVYRIIAEAEGHAHGKPVDEIHFHEVGTMDAVADVVGTCALLEELNVDRIVVSPIHVGTGHVHCAHGVLPVPAPATAYILQDVPIYTTEIQGELCTPTGAALLKHFAAEFGNMPSMKILKTGYGMGNKDFARANCVRAMLGEATAEKSDSTGDQVSELQCNLDDMTAEEIGFATELLMTAGALDVWTTSIQMKKNRPGVMLSCLCRVEETERFASLIFGNTTTLGVRVLQHRRLTLFRSEQEVQTSMGPVSVKYAEGYGVARSKPAYEDIKRIAQESGRSVTEVRRQLLREL